MGRPIYDGPFVDRLADTIRCMGIMKSISNAFAPSDPELVEKTLARLDEQDTWNDVFSTKLFELLDGNDALLADVRKAVQQASACSKLALDSEALAYRAERAFNASIDRQNQATDKMVAASRAFEQAAAEAEMASQRLTEANTRFEAHQRAMEAKLADCLRENKEGLSEVRLNIEADQAMARSRQRSSERRLIIFQLICVAALWIMFVAARTVTLRPIALAALLAVPVLITAAVGVFCWRSTVEA